MVALEKPGSRVSARQLVIANIATIIGAALTLFWNVATTYAKFEQIEQEQARLNAVQRSMSEEQATQRAEILREQEARQLLDGRIYRLEDLGLRSH